MNYFKNIPMVTDDDNIFIQYLNYMLDEERKNEMARNDLIAMEEAISAMGEAVSRHTKRVEQKLNPTNFRRDRRKNFPTYLYNWEKLDNKKLRQEGCKICRMDDNSAEPFDPWEDNDGETYVDTYTGLFRLYPEGYYSDEEISAAIAEYQEYDAILNNWKESDEYDYSWDDGWWKDNYHNNDIIPTTRTFHSGWDKKSYRCSCNHRKMNGSGFKSASTNFVYVWNGEIVVRQ